nr:MAG TPA: hypothetical protein [Caudoviricetes sp.]
MQNRREGKWILRDVLFYVKNLRGMQINRALCNYFLLISNLYFTRAIKNPRHCLGSLLL